MFWDTVKGINLAETLERELPRLTEKLDILIQTNLTATKPEKQMAEYVEKDQVQQYIKKQIDHGYCFVDLIPGRTPQDDVLVILKK